MMPHLRLGATFTVNKTEKCVKTLRLYQIIVRPILELCSVILGYIRDGTDQKIEAVKKKQFLYRDISQCFSLYEAHYEG